MSVIHWSNRSCAAKNCKKIESKKTRKLRVNRRISMENIAELEQFKHSDFCLCIPGWIVRFHLFINGIHWHLKWFSWNGSCHHSIKPNMALVLLVGRKRLRLSNKWQVQDFCSSITTGFCTTWCSHFYQIYSWNGSMHNKGIRKKSWRITLANFCWPLN